MGTLSLCLLLLIIIINNRKQEKFSECQAGTLGGGYTCPLHNRVQLLQSQ